MRLKILLILFILLSKPLFACCQSPVSIRGTVISSNGQQPIPGVSINLAGKYIGTVTNDEGKFTFVASLSPGDSLKVSCLGYKSKTIELTHSTSRDILISLDTLIQQLKEVTVRPLTLKQLLDSIVLHNKAAFIDPMKINGYYREFVFTNAKCTEYSDALCAFYYKSAPKSTAEGQLKILASRCEKAVEVKDRHNQEVYLESKISPDKSFQYAMLAPMIDKYFPDKELEKYQYSIEQSTDRSPANNWIVTITPKIGESKSLYRLIFFLADDFTVQSYKFEIPDELLKLTREVNILGIHAKLGKLSVEVSYEHSPMGIYPKYYKTGWAIHIWGKFMGVNMNETDENKSQYVTTQINTADLTPFPKSEVYKKGNICNNGAAINDTLLKNYNFIQPTKKDSLAIQSLNLN